MKPNTLLITTALLAVFSLSAGAKPPQPAAIDALDRQVPDWLEHYRVPAVAIAAIQDGQLTWTRVHGERSPGVPADERSVFNAASLTKPVFAMLVLRMVAAGDLKLDQGLSEHWVDPDLRDDPRHRQLTPRLLLSHQGGFGNWRGRAPLAFAFDPGARHEYSGEGFEYLRRAIENGSGKTLRALMQQHVLEPAQMQASFGWNEDLQAKIVQATNEAGDPIDTGLSERGPNAAANLLISAVDYARFGAWVIKGAGLPEPLFAEMQRAQAQHPNPAENFGLGWKLSGSGEAATLWHDGREAGTRSLVILRPQRRDGLVVLSNGSNGELLMRPILRAALSEGEALLRQRDADVWRYLQSLPAAALKGLFGAIARSPSFMSTLLHAAHSALIEPTTVDDARKQQGRGAIDRFALAMLRGEIAMAQVEAVLQPLLSVDTAGNPSGLLSNFEPEQTRAWLATLEAEPSSAPAAAIAAQATAAEAGDTTIAEAETRAVVDLPGQTLARYAGRYRVPSSQLLITISATGDHLRAAAAGTPTTDFFAASERLFFMRESATEFEFVSDDSGAVKGIRIIWDGQRSEFAAREP